MADQETSSVGIPLLTVPEVAERLRVAPNTVWRWLAAGRFRVVRVGYVTRIRPADLDAFLLAHLQGGEPTSLPQEVAS
jgi:excisionase family DNA binding protein